MLRRMLPLLVFLALATLLGAGILLSRNPDREALPSTLIGKPAPAFTLPVLLNASDPSAPIGVVHGGDLAGAPYLLNVWGSWCVNCREEHLVITALAKRGIVKVVGYDYHEENAEDPQRWLAQFGNPYALIVSDPDGRTALDWGIYGAPETYFVDARGIVRWKHVGPLSDEIVARELMPLLQSNGARR
jgi:cytochrome c biogenesis protein CcmG/thiol:disulfide interchange protein DsbE